MISESKQVCVALVPTGNSLCAQLPPGLNASIKMDNQGGASLITYLYDFNYTRTDRFCVNCTDCPEDFNTSTNVQVTLESYDRKTSFITGAIYQMSEDTQYCFLNGTGATNGSYMEVEKNRLCYDAAVTERCNLFQDIDNIDPIRGWVRLYYNSGDPVVLQYDTSGASSYASFDYFFDATGALFLRLCFDGTSTRTNFFNYFTPVLFGRRFTHAVFSLTILDSKGF